MLSSVCATSVGNSGVYVYYLKNIVSDYGFLWNTPLLVHLQPTKLSNAQALPISWLGGSTRGLQPGGHVHKSVIPTAGIHYKLRHL